MGSHLSAGPAREVHPRKRLAVRRASRALVGLSFWLTARALVPVPLEDLGFYTGVFAIASLAGLFAFFAPVGLGVREAVLVALLRPRLGTADALLVAAASRGVLTIV